MQVDSLVVVRVLATWMLERIELPLASGNACNPAKGNPLDVNPTG